MTVVEHVWWTPKEVAAYARVSIVTVHRHLAAKTMRSTQPCPRGHHRVHRDWAEEWAFNRPPLPTSIRRARSRRTTAT